MLVIYIGSIELNVETFVDAVVYKKIGLTTC